MNTAKQNIALLPEWCWGVLPEDKSLIKIKAGETGFYPHKGDERWLGQGREVHKVQSSSDLADMLNKDMGITKGQRKAMEWGSMFGWEHGLSNPERYTENGEIKDREIISKNI